MKAWENVLFMPVPGRSRKPRKTGYTMIIDKGLGVESTRDLVRLAADYIDTIKLTFGTSAFYDEEILREKNKIITEAGIDVMPGGTFMEVAVWQKAYDQYLERAKILGFTEIEVSDGTIEIDPRTRRDLIRKAKAAGFGVISEVGKKDPREKVPSR